MSRGGLWARIGAVWAAAAALLALADPPAIGPSWSAAVAAPLGLAAGTALFLASGGSLRHGSAPRISVAAVLVVSAAAEETVWRWFALGELAAGLGLPVGIAASSVLFALAHRDGFVGRFAAGAVFGAVYALTGSLVAACCAHAAYNVAVAAARSTHRAREATA